MFPRNVLLIVSVELPQVLDTIHELGYTSGDVMITVETDGAISYGFRPADCL